MKEGRGNWTFSVTIPPELMEKLVPLALGAISSITRSKRLLRVSIAIPMRAARKVSDDEEKLLSAVMSACSSIWPLMEIVRSMLTGEGMLWR